MRRILRITDAISLVLVIWLGLVLVPVQWVWFDPGPYFVADSSVEEPPRVEFERKIKRDVQMTYSVVIRKVGSRDAVCDPVRGPFTYEKAAAMPHDADLVWWTGGDKRCWPREVGSYLSETCWTVVRPFWGLVPPKTVCERGNGGAPFHVTSVAPEKASEAIERQQQLEQRVNTLSRGLQIIQRSIGATD